MHYTAILAALALSLAPLSSLADDATTAARPVRGLIHAVDAENRLLLVGPMTFYVPEPVLDFDEVEEGLWAIVAYQQLGDRLTAVKVELDATID